ncbi:hypothetical protein EGW08_002262 [Elysia chlorotica]|uniref:NAD-dependent epimerase/dehydratase domain-containing protein n=1 Tax=Elysia chlorotica TaxID=188477 RepID=A0A433U852_ELYCH|nr:hypothetical protein EGW08_002262 [Elysia chlorotica]
MPDPLVLVTGASGFLATHVVKLLQEKGYRVRGTVRSLKNTEKNKHLHNLCPNSKHRLELVEADLNDDDSWPSAVEGCEFIHHVASPFPLDEPKDEAKVIEPAVKGTLGVLKAAAKSGAVKRVVITSSCIAIGYVGGNKVPKTEDDWTDLKDPSSTAYPKSKHLAEKAAWDFVAKLPANEKFELAVINPCFIVGPMLHSTAGTSTTIIKQLLMREVPMVPQFNIGMCDVRDCAEAHLRCMTLPEAVGHRHIIFESAVWLKEAADILREEFASQGYNPPSLLLPNWVVWLASWFSSMMATRYRTVMLPVLFDNSRMRNVLKIDPIPHEKSLVDMAYSMIETGHVPKTDKYRGPHAAEKN